MRMALILVIIITFLALNWRITRQQTVRLRMSSPMPTLIRPTTNNSTGKTPLTILVSVRYGGMTLPLGPVLSESARIAIETIEKVGLLEKYELRLQLIDNECAQNVGVSRFLEAMFENDEAKNRVPLFIGSECGEQILTGQMMPFFNFTALTVGGLLPIYRERRRYSSYFMLTPSAEIFAAAIPAFAYSQGWQNVYLFTETWPFNSDLDQIMLERCNALGIRVKATVKVFSLPGSYATSDTFQAAVAELRSFNPRIIILNTNYGPQAACWIHRFGLFGPSYVYLANPFLKFFPDSPAKYRPWCTERMLFEVMQSIIFFDQQFSFSSAMRSVDSLGMTLDAINQKLFQRVNPADNSFYYGCCRTHLYEEVVSAALALNATETELQRRNETLGDWVTSSDRFRNNGAEILSILKRNVGDLVYSGFIFSLNKSTNARQGVSRVAQYLAIRQPDENQTANFNTLLKESVVASYDSRQSNARVEQLAPIVWRTWESHTPYDSLQTIYVKDPLISQSANGVILAIACLVLVIVLVLGLNIKRRSALQNTIPMLNAALLLGDIFLLIGVLAVPADGVWTANINCMARSFLFVIGLALLSCSLTSKLHLAERLLNSTLRQSIGAQRRLVAIRKHLKLASFGSCAFCVLTIALVVVWFSLSPIDTVRIDHQLEVSTQDLSVAYQHYSYACSITARGAVTSQTLIGILVAMFGITFIRAGLLAFFLRKRTFDEISDLALVRITIYGLAVLLIAGAIIVGAFFAEEPGSLETGISILAILIVLVSTIPIFDPKAIVMVRARNKVVPNATSFMAKLNFIRFAVLLQDRHH